MKKFISIACLLLMTEAFAAEALISINGHLFEVELAVTREERKQGLMYRDVLAPNQGMLFVYPGPQIISFWMKQTLIPLDILFFDREGRLVQSFKNVQPCRISPCKTYTNTEPAQYVLELPAGSAKRIRLTAGNSFEILKR